MKLVIGNYTYSSWSFRPWWLMRAAGLDVDVVRIPLDTDETAALLKRWCPAGQVPVLHDGPLVLWDSLAICEYIADRHPRAGLWPDATDRRARARAMCSEMHSGFRLVRKRLPMNCRRRVQGFTPDLDTTIEINRLVQLFEDALDGSEGPGLFDRWGVVDAMFVPIASRFRTYGVRTPRATSAWMQRVLEHPASVEWYAAAAAETDVIAAAEIADRASPETL